MEDDDVVGWDT